MIITPSDDDIYKVFRNPVIYDAVASDTAPPIDEWVIDRSGEYVGYYIDGEIAAVWVHHEEPEGCEVHIQVLPEYRKKYSRAILKAFIQYTWTVTKSDKLVANIPVLYPNVIKAANDVGFEEVRKTENKYPKNGKLWDEVTLYAYREGLK